MFKFSKEDIALKIRKQRVVLPAGTVLKKTQIEERKEKEKEK